MSDNALLDINMWLPKTRGLWPSVWSVEVASGNSIIIFVIDTDGDVALTWAIVKRMVSRDWANTNQSPLCFIALHTRISLSCKASPRSPWQALINPLHIGSVFVRVTIKVAHLLLYMYSRRMMMKLAKDVWISLQKGQAVLCSCSERESERERVEKNKESMCKSILSYHCSFAWRREEACFA